MGRGRGNSGRQHVSLPQLGVRRDTQVKRRYVIGAQLRRVKEFIVDVGAPYGHIVTKAEVRQVFMDQIGKLYAQMNDIDFIDVEDECIVEIDPTTGRPKDPPPRREEAPDG